jgi:hyperosmotically inducible periplasmic protein
MRGLLRAALILTLLLIVGFFVFGYWTGSYWRERANPAPAPTGTTGTIDTEKARQRGAEIGEKAAVATAKAKETLAETGVTAKIKAKMALDDTIKARAIDVSTNGTTVTLTGTVGSPAERERALALARETAGVTHVVDGLHVVK